MRKMTKMTKTLISQVKTKVGVLHAIKKDELGPAGSRPVEFRSPQAGRAVRRACQSGAGFSPDHHGIAL